MNATELVYMTDMQKLNDTATVLSVSSSDGEEFIVVLDRTIFYPQGGGQPADRGSLQTESCVFTVNDVRFADGLVHHKGLFTSGSFRAGAKVDLLVEPQRRRLNSRLHTAGHLIDYALGALGVKLVAGKGYHFPDGPYVEYEGMIEGEASEGLMQQLEQRVSQIISDDLSINVQIVNYEQLESLFGAIPSYIPAGKPARIMTANGFLGIPCGGTHVASTGKVGKLLIVSVKAKKGKTKICYNISE